MSRRYQNIFCTVSAYDRCLRATARDLVNSTGLALLDVWAARYQCKLNSYYVIRTSVPGPTR